MLSVIEVDVHTVALLGSAQDLEASRKLDSVCFVIVCVSMRLMQRSVTYRRWWPTKYLSLDITIKYHVLKNSFLRMFISLKI